MATIKIKEDIYHLRLTTYNMVGVEEQLGKSLTEVFTPVSINMEGGVGENLKLPSIKDIAIIFHGAIKTSLPEMKFVDSCKLVDDFLDEHSGLGGVYELYAALGKACNFFKDAPLKTETVKATKATAAAKSTKQQPN